MSFVTEGQQRGVALDNMRDASRTRLNWTFILIWTMLGIEIFSMSILPSFWLPILGGLIFGTSALFCYLVTRDIKDEGSEI
jgi:hypothetical protein